MKKPQLPDTENIRENLGVFYEQIRDSMPKEEVTRRLRDGSTQLVQRRPRPIRHSSMYFMQDVLEFLIHPRFKQLLAAKDWSTCFLKDGALTLPSVTFSYADLTTWTINANTRAFRGWIKELLAVGILLKAQGRGQDDYTLWLNPSLIWPTSFPVQ